MEAIVAVYSDWGIGDGGTQPVVLSADRVHFKEVTDGCAVIVGRKTLEDFPGKRPLKGRNNIVVTRQNIQIDGAEIAHTTDEAVEISKKYERTLVIGGASIYEQFYPYMDKVYITKIDCKPDSIRFFPNLDEDKKWVITEESPWLEENGVMYCFCTYERKL